MYKKIVTLVTVPLLCLSGYASYAAQPIDLSKQKMSLLQSLVAAPIRPTLTAAPVMGAQASDKVEEISQSVDFNKTKHIRVRQTHKGYAVWGAEGVVHIPKAGSGSQTLLTLAAQPNQAESSMNGKVYQDLDADLRDTPEFVFSASQLQKAQDQALTLSRQHYAFSDSPTTKESRLMVYVDENNKAHWAFYVSLILDSDKPIYIMDAQTLQVYKAWNNVQTLGMAKKGPQYPDVDGGGFGGNPKTGKLAYDNLSGHLPEIAEQRDPATKTCYLQNEEVTVKDGRKQLNKTKNVEQMVFPVASYPCEKPDAEHNNLYWDNTFDEANEGYSPSNDAVYAGYKIKRMYQDWYGIPMLTTRNGKPMHVEMISHFNHFKDQNGNESGDNAEWDEELNVIRLGDGAEDLYPLTSVGVIAHEISHGFTEQHSNLVYEGQSGGLNESFSDMAAQASETYAYGKNTWEIGPEVVKMKNAALRYMIQPSKDCEGRPSSGGHKMCSIDEASQYYDGINVHFSSGVFNRAFYLISTTPGWDVKKTFGVMIQANSNYWTPTSTYKEAACGVLKATSDFKYDSEAVTKAFKTVGLDTRDC